MALNERFFAAVRATLYGGKLTNAQVEGLNAIAAAFEKHGDGDRRKLAYIMATAHHETGRQFGPRVENLNYTSAARIVAVWPKRFTLETAKAYVRRPVALANKVYNGRLGNRPGSNDGWDFRGRGLPMLTGYDHYVWFGKELGVDLAGQPDLALQADIGAAALVIGMVRGKFTGKALAPGVPDYVSARATINADAGTKSADGKTFGSMIAGYAQKFEVALKAGWSPGAPAGQLEPVPTVPLPEPPETLLSILLAAIAAFFMRIRKEKP